MWIKGFENRYEITTDGRVFFHKNGKKVERKLVPDKDGYMTINLKIKSKVFCKKIHREVAKTFIYPYYGEQVNHINGIKCDNRIDNLEWCSNEQNNKHMWETGLKQLGKKYISNSTGFYGVTQNGNRFIAKIKRGYKSIYLGTYETIEEASDIIKKNIINEANGIDIKEFKLLKKIFQYDKNMNLINIYNSVANAEKETGFKNQSISKAILGINKTCGGFIWKRQEDKIFI